MSILATTRAFAPTTQAEWTYAAAEAPPSSEAISTKPPAYVLGEQVGKVFQLFQSTHPKSTSCYDGIVKKYPDISTDIKEAVTIICDNANEHLSFPDFQYLKRDELEALGAAISKNTAMKWLEISWDIEGDSVEGIAPLIRALRENTTLKKLTFQTTSPGFSTSALRLLSQNVPCFHLDEIDMYQVDEYVMTDASALAQSLASPNLPLSGIVLPWLNNDDGESAQAVADGLAKSRCITMINTMAAGTREGDMNHLLEAFKTTKALSTVLVYDDFNETLALNTVKENTCITNAVFSEGSDEFQKALNKTLAGRTPCERSSTCATPLTNCPNPPKAPAGQDDEPLSPAAWFFIGAASIATVLGLTGLAVWLRQKGKQKNNQLLGDQ